MFGVFEREGEWRGEIRGRDRVSECVIIGLWVVAGNVTLFLDVRFWFGLWDGRSYRGEIGV